MIVFHLEQMIEDLGHLFIQAFESFAEMKDKFESLQIDCALVDMDLADGRTGPEAAAWLCRQGVPALFVTGQEHLAEDHRDVVAGVISKPVSLGALADGLRHIAQSQGNASVRASAMKTPD